VIWAAFTLAASALLSIFFSLVYPGWFTYHAKQQTAWRWAYIWAGWVETLELVSSYVQQYHLASHVGLLDVASTIRRANWPVTYDFVNPFVAILALLFAATGGSSLIVYTVILSVFKSPLVAYRAFMNQVHQRELWLRNARLGCTWLLSLLFVVPAVLLSLPIVALGWAIVGAFQATLAVSASGGDINEGTRSALESLYQFNLYTTRYFYNQDVPYADYSNSSRPLSPLYALLGLLFGFPLALTFTPLILLVPFLLNILPAFSTSATKCVKAMGWDMSKKRAPLAVLCFISLPISVPVSLLAVYLFAIFQGTVKVASVIHARRSLQEGLNFILGNCYKWEYFVNKFVFGGGGGRGEK